MCVVTRRALTTRVWNRAVPVELSVVCYELFHRDCLPCPGYTVSISRLFSLSTLAFAAAESSIIALRTGLSICISRSPQNSLRVRAFLSKLGPVLPGRRSIRLSKSAMGEHDQLIEPGFSPLKWLLRSSVRQTGLLQAANVSLLLTFRALPRQLIEESKYHHKVYRIYLLSYKQFLIYISKKENSVAAVLSR